VTRRGAYLLAALAALGCRQDMHDQPKLKPYAASEFFADARGARQLVAGTVARGQLREDALAFTGKQDGKFAQDLPFPVTLELLQRGQERFAIYCTPCHGQTGRGDGIVVRRGYRKPTSFHDDRMRGEPVGYFFDVMTNGFGAMPDYAAQVALRDRWAIAAYAKALQLSQHADVKQLGIAMPAPAASPEVHK
jgi:mono/diheme cytochrome c family protein